MSRLKKLNTKEYRVGSKDEIKLSKIDASDVGSYDGDGGKDAARADHKSLNKRLAELQNLFYADGSRSLLVVLQAIDAGGKDSTIRKVFSGINPQGVEVTSFKVPSKEEFAHDYLWRIHKHAPAKGMIGIFNRSHYEEVLVTRVEKLIPEKTWKERYEHLNNFEALLDSNGTKIVKIYLHISKDEQKDRFQDRLDDPSKHWKFDEGDLEKRKKWDDYMEAFEDAINKCSTDESPWYIIPANKKWFRNVLISKVLVETIEAMNLTYPQTDLDPSQIKIV